ncbi:MAG: D-alanine--D-alanine ligase [Phycisphaeraceae bacterium]|nr:D-alanine--D-alanine ligase [Phycisphaeraceae bacterium]
MNTDPRKPTVLVLAGGPDAERQVSIDSAGAIRQGLLDEGFPVEHRCIDAITLDELRAMPGDVVFPALHGPWGEGGPMQDLLEQDGRPFVGARARTARLAMDKMGSKLLAATLGARTAVACAFNASDHEPPLPLPVVIKPVHEGSTVGLFVCRTRDQWNAAHAATKQRAVAAQCAAMVEPYIAGRELTVGVLAGRTLPIVEITPAEGLYDYQAKYHRDDTIYTVDPGLPPGVAQRITHATAAIARAIGAEQISRSDWLLDATGAAWFLEINTMPGFTSHSLLPKAAAAVGIGFPRVCSMLVETACMTAPIPGPIPVAAT